MTSLRRKPIIYIPGLISLVALPVLIAWIFNTQRPFTDRVIEVNYRVCCSLDNKERLLHWACRNKKYCDGHFKEIILTGNDSQDMKSIRLSIPFIKRVRLAQDSLKGVRYHFDDKARYWAFVKVLDTLQTEGANVYPKADGDIWVFNIGIPYIKVEKPILICGSGHFVSSLNNQENELSGEAYWLDYLRYLWPSGLLLISMVILGLTNLYRRAKYH